MPPGVGPLDDGSWCHGDSVVHALVAVERQGCSAVVVVANGVGKRVLVYF